MSGPVTDRDVSPQPEPCHPDPPEVEVTESRTATVGSMQVRRALPRRQRRTVGAWCFVDHMGPADVTEDEGVDIGPHPHIGLQTVTWLLAGEILHRDSLGSEQMIRPGQLNLMTAGAGISHSEEHTGSYRGQLHGVQLWIAQPESTRHGDCGFEHHAELPQIELNGGAATLLVGEYRGEASPARRDSDLVGLQVDLGQGSSTPIEMIPSFEYALVVLEGSVGIDGARIEPGHLAYLGKGRDGCELSTGDGARALLLGGVPFDEPVLMWWNFVARTRDEIAQAHSDWMGGDDRFGVVDSPLARIPVGAPPWATEHGS